MLKRRFSKGFTLLEVIIVLVVLGVVSSIGASIYSNLISTYLLEKAKYSATITSGNTARQVANYLSYAIGPTVRAVADDGSTKPLAELDDGDENKFTGIEWIAVDSDGLNQGYWSGFVDLDTSVSNEKKLKSVGSVFKKERKLLDALFGGEEAGVIFTDYPFYKRKSDGTELEYTTECMYQGTCLYPVTLGGNNKLNVSGTKKGETIFTELYLLAGSAYTIKAEKDGDLYRLWLYYGYKPWKGETRSDGEKVLLQKDISVFRFTQQQRLVRIKVCSQKKAGDKPIFACTEKVVLK